MSFICDGCDDQVGGVTDCALCDRCMARGAIAVNGHISEGLIRAAPDLLDTAKAILDFEAGRIPLAALVEIANRNISKAEGQP